MYEPIGPDIGDAATGDDDLLVFQPFAGMHRQQSSDFDRKIGGALAESHEDEVLPDGDLAGGIQYEIVVIDLSGLRIVYLVNRFTSLPS